MMYENLHTLLPQTKSRYLAMIERRDARIARMSQACTWMIKRREKRIAELEGWIEDVRQRASEVTPLENEAIERWASDILKGQNRD